MGGGGASVILSAQDGNVELRATTTIASENRQ
jgi:hypothetical protein